MDLPIVVLVIEDEQIDFRLLQRALRDYRNIELLWESTLTNGLGRLKAQHIDVVLLDLSLPGSSGLATIGAITQRSSTPIVVMSNTKDEQTALNAVKHGAQDYLFKDQMDPLLITRTLRYSVERFNLLTELRSREQIDSRDRRDSELQRLKTNLLLEDIASTGQESEVDRYESNYPQAYKKILVTYQELLLFLMERREYQVEAVNVSELLKQIASKLGLGAATPHDALAVHTVSVQVVLEQLPNHQNELCHQEARYLLSGLLGHLCYFYKVQLGDQQATLLDSEEIE